ncbi:MAG: hypothetical protein HY908_29435 [Myxococcales bacterium]|nr:hypothetical protein [Myxococcales bacterium]
MSDPFPSSNTKGQWQSIRGQKELIFMGADRMFEWEPGSGSFRLWHYDRYASGDPLPGSPVAQGSWSSIRSGHELVYLFQNRLLDWEPSSGKFRVWNFDRNNSSDPLPNTSCEGQWNSIRGAHKLIYIDGDQVLDWEPSTGKYRLWAYDRNHRSDPFPGSALVSGEWSSIRSGHELVYLSNDKMLDWEPGSGAYKVWRVDRHNSQDLLPGSPVAEGKWQTIVGHRKLYRVAEDQVLDWEPESGKYTVWRVQV